MAEAYADWREAGGGLKMPFQATLQQNGKKVGEATITAYQFNTGLKAEDLSREAISKKP